MQITVALLIIRLQRNERVRVQSAQDNVGNSELVQAISEKVSGYAIRAGDPQWLVARRIRWLPSQDSTHDVLLNGHVRANLCSVLPYLLERVGRYRSELLNTLTEPGR